jgi:hypothetical protein
MSFIGFDMTSYIANPILIKKVVELYNDIDTIKIPLVYLKVNKDKLEEIKKHHKENLY